MEDVYIMAMSMNDVEDSLLATLSFGCQLQLGQCGCEDSSGVRQQGQLTPSKPVLEHQPLYPAPQIDNDALHIPETAEHSLFSFSCQCC